MSITAAVMLSLYRISGTRTDLALFITFSVINAIYCCKSDSPPAFVRFNVSALTVHSNLGYLHGLFPAAGTIKVPWAA
jgi:hypothetical protein